MELQATALPAIDSQPPDNIYEKFIIPFIESTKSGDELLFISPSTFFGYHSLGAKNFIRVCECLRSAKARDVKIRLIADIHDILTVKAAEGLLTFLLDGIEFKHMEGNTDTYYLLIYGISGKSRYVSFLCRRPETERYLPGVQARPFKRVDHFEEDIPNEDAVGKRTEFYRLWEHSATRVVPVINRYIPGYQIRRRIVFLQSMSYLLTLCLGLVMGISFVSQGLPARFDPVTILILLLTTAGVGLVTGFVGTALANWFANKFLN
jgi:hypothetical protein